MKEYSQVGGNGIGQIYDQQSAQYVDFSEVSYSWRFLERPSFDKYISDFYLPETKILEAGCGTGRVIKYLISKGIRPENIVGFDISSELLAQARQNVPGVRLFSSSVDSFELPPESVDLVVSNMVIHHFDNKTLEDFLNRTYDVLVPGGTFFFVDTDPDYLEEGRDPDNIDKWLPMQTPWGETVPYFNKHPRDILNLMDLCGFDLISGWIVRPVPEGLDADWRNYLKYFEGPSRRMAGCFKKVSEAAKKKRSNPNWKILSLTDDY